MISQAIIYSIASWRSSDDDNLCAFLSLKLLRYSLTSAGGRGYLQRNFGPGQVPGPDRYDRLPYSPKGELVVEMGKA